jgi:hypothetical protein
VTTDMGSLDMTKRSRDLVERGAAAFTSGSGQIAGPAAVILARSGAVVQGCADAPGLRHRRPGAGCEAQRLASGGLHSSGLR